MPLWLVSCWSPCPGKKSESCLATSAPSADAWRWNELLHLLPKLILNTVDSQLPGMKLNGALPRDSNLELMIPEVILSMETYAFLGNSHFHSLWDNYPGLIFNVDIIPHTPWGGGQGKQ